MKIEDIKVQAVKLPFRLSFKHSLASRSFSENLIVRAEISDGKQIFIGYGEGIPRDYVTGETIDQSIQRLQREFLPRFSGRHLDNSLDLIKLLEQEFFDLNLVQHSAGAAWCALELALLDAFGHAEGKSVSALLGGINQAHSKQGIRYGAVVPFASLKKAFALLCFYKLAGFNTVKLKLGNDNDSNLSLVRMAREILGDETKLRVDVNCAWDAETTIIMAERMRPFAIASIEQPLPAHDLAGLAKISLSIPEPIMVDESLCTIEQAQLIAKENLCSAFNIRLSKVGGMLAAQKILDIASAFGIFVQMGAQVGESGVLSAAGRTFAAINKPFENCEGSNNLFLLKKDLTRENLNVGWGGWGHILTGPGLGTKVEEKRLSQLLISRCMEDRNLVTAT